MRPASTSGPDLICRPPVGGHADIGSVARPVCSSALNRFRNPACTRREPEGPTLVLFGSEELSDNSIDTSDIDAMLTRLEELRARHRELDSSIEKLEASGGDDIRIMGLKREKLRVKDSIVWLSSRITPDIIA
jgi:hypothetical protein